MEGNLRYVMKWWGMSCRLQKDELPWLVQIEFSPISAYEFSPKYSNIECRQIPEVLRALLPKILCLPSKLIHVHVIV